MYVRASFSLVCVHQLVLRLFDPGWELDDVASAPTKIYLKLIYSKMKRVYYVVKAPFGRRRPPFGIKC